MINITTKENNLGHGKKFLYRSYPEKNVTTEQLYDELENYNSTVTKADSVSVLTSFTEILFRLAADGCVVNTPFGKFKATVSGGTQNSEESFKLGKDDNTINLSFYMSKEQKKAFLEHASYTMRSAKYRTDPFIDSVFIKNKNCDKTLCTEFYPGDIVELHGEHLAFKGTNDGQGVYLISEKDNSVTKIDSYLRTGTALITFQLPQNLSEGSFKIKVVTKPSAEHIGYCIYGKSITVH